MSKADQYVTVKYLGNDAHEFAPVTGRRKKMKTKMTIRYSEDATICMTDDDGYFSAPTQEEMDILPVGEDLTEDEIEGLES